MLGGVIFNCAYALALRSVQRLMIDDGIALRLPKHHGPFWTKLVGASETPPANEPCEHVVDATFVDDEAIILVTRSPRILMRSLMRVLDVLVQTFKKFQMEINCSPGNTEAFLALRGKNATRTREQLRCSDGALRVLVPGTSASLIVVTEYKNLGSVTSVSGCSSAFVRSRAATAMGAYAPLSKRTFQCEWLGVQTRLSFC